jgi:hypothetical protein
LWETICSVRSERHYSANRRLWNFSITPKLIELFSVGQTHVYHKTFRPITLTSTYVSDSNTWKFRNTSLYYPQFMFIDFVHNFKAGMKFRYQILCLLKNFRILCLWVLETTVLCPHYSLLCQLVILPYLNYWYVGHTAEWFLSEYVLNGNRTLDVVQEERLRYCFCFRNEL